MKARLRAIAETSRKGDFLPLYLGIDSGTQGTKTLLVDRDGNVRGNGYAPHRLVERDSGAREQDPAWWVEALCAAVKQAVQVAPAHEVIALGVSGQQHGLVALDENLQVIRPAKLWNDTETAAANAALIEHFGGREKFFKRFGFIPLTGYTVSKLAWMKQQEPGNFARIRHILLPHEYLNFWLTGNLCAECGDASGTAFFDVRSRAWLPEILDAIDGGTGQLSGALPRLLKTDEPAGTVLSTVAETLGISPRCIVAPGGGDNMMGAIGTGNVQPGVVTLSLGTSSTVYTYRDGPLLDRTGCVAAFCSSSGGWLPLVCTMNATNVVMQTLQVLGKTVADIDPVLLSTQPGADGLTFLPFLNGERTPDLPNARGSLVGISANNFNADNLVRAVIEGVSFGILQGLGLVLGGEVASSIRLIGGGSRSAQWRKLLADASGALIEVPLQEEAGCLGAAMQAMYVMSHLTGQPESFAVIAERCVRMDTARTAHPDPALREEYANALHLYRKRLSEIYGAQISS
jgi:xylulokinase